MTEYVLYFIGKDNEMSPPHSVVINEDMFFDNISQIYIWNNKTKERLYKNFFDEKLLVYYESTIEKLNEEITNLRKEILDLRSTEDIYRTTCCLFD